MLQNQTPPRNLSETRMNKGRNYALDLLRVLACYLVIQQHASEFYYIGENGTVVTGENTFWIGIITSICRISVPLFVMISGYLLLPMRDTIPVFFRKRFTRVLYPFLVWCVIYAIYFVFSKGDTLEQMALNIFQIPVNFGTQVGHLWYIYMLIGLYLLIPIISPWLRSASKKELQGYLILWIITSFLPYIHLLFPEVLGECAWNSTPMLYYFTGFAGYLILGYYMKTYGRLSVSVSIFLLLAGYAVTTYIYCTRIDTASNVVALELSWQFCAVNVVAATVGTFSLFQVIKAKGENSIGELMTSVSNLSYGMYLAHIIILNFYYQLLKDISTSALITVPLISACTFITVYLIMRLLSFLPKSKYLVG